MKFHNLITLKFDNHDIYILLEGNQKSDTVVVYLHGFGEDRTGINYFFSENSRKIIDNGYATCRFDWFGFGSSCGEVTDLQTLNRQFSTIMKYLTSHFSQIHICARNICRIFLKKNNTYGKTLLIGHSSFNNINMFLLSKYLKADNKVSVIQNMVSCDEKIFWENIGFEYNSVGGMQLPLSLFQEIYTELKEKCYVDYLFLTSGENNFLDNTIKFKYLVSLDFFDTLVEKEDNRMIIHEKICNILM